MFLEQYLPTFIQNIFALQSFDDYRQAVLKELLKCLPFDSAAFFLIDSSTEFSSPVHYNLPDTIFKEYGDYYHQFDIYKECVFAQNSIPLTDRASDYMDFGEWAKNEHRSDFLLKNDIYHLACLQIFDGNNLKGEITLHRSKNLDFSNEEMKYLSLISPYIQLSLQNQLKYREAAVLEKLFQHMLNTSAKAMIIFDQEFRALFLNHFTDKLLQSCSPSDQRNFWVRIRSLCQEFQNSLLHPNVAEKKLGMKEVICNGCPYELNINIFNEKSMGKNYFLCELTPYKGFNAVINSCAKRLTRKELVILKLILEGKSNVEIAATLSLSIYTVKTHVKNILFKYDATSRLELLSRLVQTY